MDEYRHLALLSAEEIGAIVETAIARALAARNAKPVEAADHVTIKEAAALMRCSVNTVRRRVRLGKLKAAAAAKGSRVLITRASVMKLLKAT